ncbi:LysR family transcriptional regulator [Edaphobacter modestus]|uniref:DNA-binding transcriptional LysR family regulator n=1 Tax=Edaphobacter modestus TaxID=388466 RepID=A0A4Q7Z1N2_9BACT|nr:LysR substrate-binding domain-containing protein [Edaphobacter modestus]RZU43435.1 DNA-binding transcriptional LysR family regulator [Edaphobacter modestus]
MELRHFRYLVAAAEQGSFSGAARRLNVAQSAISEQLADLEREIGVQLFTRSSRRTGLTPSGELFLKEARRILADSEKAVEIARRAQRGEIGTLNIGFFVGSVGVNFPRLIRGFRKQHPGVRLSLVEMTSTRQWQALVDGEIDVGFTRRVEPEFRTELVSELIHQDPINAIVPKDHPVAPGPVDVHDLAGESFVLSSREASPAVFDKVIELCSEAGFSPRIASISSVWSSVVMMVQAGEGIALLPLNQQQSRTRDLAFCPLLAKNAFVEFVMAWSPKHDSDLNRSFRTLVKAHSNNSGTRP